MHLAFTFLQPTKSGLPVRPVCPRRLIIVVIGSSPPLAYCNILSQCPVSALIYIFAYVFIPVAVCTCVRIGCTPRLHCRNLLRCCRFQAVLTCLLPYDEKSPSRDSRCVQTWGAISLYFSSQMLLNEGRQCCESWRDVELGVRAVCAMGDTTDEDR